MPTGQAVSSATEGNLGAGDLTNGKASIGQQVAQLVVIPSVIVLICIGFFFLFGLLAGQPDSLQNQLSRLRQSSGIGRGPFGLQDPRYKDRSLAAANIARRLPKITDPEQRDWLSSQLVGILKDHVGSEEDELRIYMLLAIGQLGQEEDLDVILAHCDSERSKVLEGAIGGLLSWVSSQDDKRLAASERLEGGKPDAQAVFEEVDRLHRRGVQLSVPKLIQLVTKGPPVVQAEAAAGLGALADRGDIEVMAALREAMEGVGLEQREVQWNAAIALAKLGDEMGGRIVAEVLLNRHALAEMPAAESGRLALQKMNTGMQSRVILTTLAAAEKMTDTFVQDMIRQIADNDPSPGVRAAAKSLLMRRDEGWSNSSGTEPVSSGK